MPTVRLGRAVALSEVETLQAALRATLEGREPVILEGEGVVYVDTAGLQLLVAFVQAARIAEITVTWGPVAPDLRGALEVSGLTEAVGLEGALG